MKKQKTTLSGKIVESELLSQVNHKNSQQHFKQYNKIFNENCFDIASFISNSINLQNL